MGVASEASLERKLRFRRKRRRLWDRKLSRAREEGKHPRKGLVVKAAKWKALEEEARKELRRERRKSEVSAAQIRKQFQTHDGTLLPASAVPIARELLTKYIRPLERKFGPATIISAYRHKTYNAKIGGASQSLHRYTELYSRSGAVDLTFRKGSPREWAKAAEKLNPGGLGIYPKSNFIHIDNRQNNRLGRARWAG